MTAKYYVDESGQFLGAFGDGARPEAGGIEVPSAPEHASQIWQGNSWAWSLDVLKARKSQALQERYAAALAAGMTYAGCVLQITEPDQQNIATMGQEARWALAGKVSWPADFAWRMADNSFLPLPDPAAMIALGEAAKAEIYRLRRVKWTHADAIASAENVAGLEAHDVNSGW